jgi:hypothetical protein
MKNGKNVHIMALIMLLLSASTGWAQEWSTGIDIYSSYVWRGTKFGSGPAFQPTVEFSAGNLVMGAWGSVNASTDEAAELDLYAGYTFTPGERTSIAITLTDYYFPGTSWTEADAHFIEPMISLSIGHISLTGAYMMNDGKGDIYLEAGLSAGPVNLFLGGGDGAYTPDGNFNLCNLGLSTLKEIKITDSFSLPVSGSIIFNPSNEQAYIVAGISL